MLVLRPRRLSTLEHSPRNLARRARVKDPSPRCWRQNRRRARPCFSPLDGPGERPRHCPGARQSRPGPPPKPLRIDGMGKWTPLLTRLPSGRRPAAFAAEKTNATHHKTTPKTLLRLVPRLDRDHGPEDLEQPEADEQQRAPGERELREGARLALGLVALLAEEGGFIFFDGARPRRRRGADAGCAARMRLVALLAEKCGFIFFDGTSSMRCASAGVRPPALLPLRRAPTAEWHVLARRASVPSVSLLLVWASTG